MSVAAERPLTRGIIVLLAALAALGALATNIILPVFPRIGAELGVDQRALTVTLSSFFIAFAVGQLVVGPFSDRFGRKWTVMSGLVLFVIGSVLCAMANDLSELVLGRIVQALGACAASVLSRAIARDLFEGPALARAMSTVMIAMAAAPGFSPLIGSTLDSLFGWRITFVLVAVIGAVLAVFYWIGAGETLPKTSRVSMSVTAILANYGRLFVDRLFLFPALAVSFAVGGLYTIFATAPAVLIGTFGLSAFQLGLFFAGTVLVVFAASFLGPRLSQRFGPARIGMVGILINLIAASLLLGLGEMLSFASFCGALTFYLFGSGFIAPLGTAITLQPFGKQAGLASALLGFLQMAFAAAGATVAAMLPMSANGALANVLLISSALSLLIFAPVAFKRRTGAQVT